MQIIEQFVEGKMNQEKCEDALVISEDFIAVIDGVTSKSDFTYDGKTTGKLAAEIIAKQIECLPQDANAQDLILAVNKSFREFYDSVIFPCDKRKMGLQAVCVVYSKCYNEIWLIGDCQCSVDGQIYLNPKKSDDILAELRSMILHIWQKEGFLGEAQKKQARDTISPWILNATAFANDDSTKYGYACINGETIPKSLIKIIALDKRVTHEIILTSDGYPRVLGSLKESEEYLNEMLTNDGDCYKVYKATKGRQAGCKSFDDRTYVRFLT